ncbi:MAG TPA: MlaD family protein [Solirubrobacteraceae bacterium]|nr:MlaD family protein [Solirubrobacteraceae bacterium]
MIARRVSALALIAAVVVAVVLVLDSGGSSYSVKMRLADAAGLRQGSPVAVGGQDVGHISMSVRHGAVVVDMLLNSGYGPVGKNASASVTSVNLLGQKRIELDKGNVGDPAPSGYVLPSTQVTVTPDLDEVIDVLTPDVRARLAILINEAGQAFTGRKADFSQMLQELPPDLNIGTKLVNGISDDNHTLAELVQHSDAFVSQLTTQRTQLVHMIKVFGQASATVEAKRAQLASTLQQAPGALSTLQTFLVKLQNTTVPLGPAAVDITNTAPALDQTLAQLNSFRRAADPTLQEATTVAPELTQLATGATPVVRQATPVVASLATFSQALAPISNIVNASVDNLVAILQNWSQAIQFRDGLSHVFRGEATVTPQIAESMINQLQQAGVLGSLQRAAKSIGKLQHTTSSAHRATRSSAPATHPSATTTSTPTSTATTGTATNGTGTTTATTSSGSAGSGSGGSGSGSGLGSLLKFLLQP